MEEVRRIISGFICFIAVLAIAISSSGVETVLADMPYTTYSYDYWGEPVQEPHSYLYSGTISSDVMGTSLNYPQDLFYLDGELYIADTGNSRILVMDTNGSIRLEITSAASSTDFLSGPQGVFVTEEGAIYVADTGNGRIVEYDGEGNYIREIGRPETTLISDSVDYSPTKVVVDNAGRIYVIAYGINMGLVEFNANGEFQGFMGATEVSVSMFTYIWKNYFSTAAQQDRMETIVPTEYSNICVDDDGFVYATINNLSADDRESGADAIRRLNPTGVDVLRRLGNYDIIGDLASVTYGWDYSSFVDVAATSFGCYFILDETDGKIFAYDYDGVSLFVFGSTGIKEGNFQKPVAMDIDEDAHTIYVLDNVLGSVLVFDITDYGNHLLEAIRLNDLGDSEGATAEWQAVLNSNSNSELAYIGLGKAYFTEGDYKEAMDCFKLGNSKKYYSKAFSYYRKEVMEKYLTPVVLGIAALALLIWLVKLMIRGRRWIEEVRLYTERQ